MPHQWRQLTLKRQLIQKVISLLKVISWELQTRFTKDTPNIWQTVGFSRVVSFTHPSMVHFTSNVFHHQVMTNNPPRDRNLKQHSILRESEIMKKASEPNCDLGKETQQYKEREWVCWNYRTQMPWSKGWTYSSRMFDWIALEHGYILSPDNQVACMKVLIAQRMCSHVIHPTPICRNAMVILSIWSCTGLHFKIAVNLNLSASSCLVCLLLPCLKLVSFCCLLLYYCLSSKVQLSQVVPGMPPLPVRPTQILLSPPKAGEDG